MIVVLAEALAEALPVQIVIAEPPALLDSFGCEANVDGNANLGRQAFHAIRLSSYRDLYAPPGSG